MVVAMEWVSRITSVSMMMVLPALCGYGLDRVLATDPWLVVAGAVFGSVLGMMQLLQLVRPAPRGGPGEGTNQKK